MLRIGCTVVSTVASTVALLVSVFPAVGYADESTDRVKQYVVHRIDGDGKLLPLNFRGKSLLNWSNPVFGTTDGGLYLWTDPSGHPAVVMKTYKTGNGRWFEQTRSFSTDQVIVESADGEVLFAPDQDAGAMLEFPGAPIPAETAAKRLLQMKAMHRQFTVQGDLPAAGGQQTLRNYPKPLYRYQSDDQRTGDSKQAVALDGALFGFMQGTGPDVMLVLEAQKSGDQIKWFYQLGSIGIFAIEVDLDDKRVWSEARRTAASTKITDLYDGRRLEE